MQESGSKRNGWEDWLLYLLYWIIESEPRWKDLHVNWSHDPLRHDRQSAKKLLLLRFRNKPVIQYASKKNPLQARFCAILVVIETERLLLHCYALQHVLGVLTQRPLCSRHPQLQLLIHINGGGVPGQRRHDISVFLVLFFEFQLRSHSSNLAMRRPEQSQQRLPLVFFLPLHTYLQHNNE